MEERTPLVGVCPQGDSPLKYPHPVYEHRVISGLTIDQLSKLEACLASDAVTFTASVEDTLYLPPHQHFSPKAPPALSNVPCLMRWWPNLEQTTQIPLVKFAKSPKRDVETGLYTVDIVIVVAIAYAEDLHEPKMGMEAAQELGMYRVDRKVRDAIDIALDLYTDKPNGEFVKMGEQHAIKSVTTGVPPLTVKLPSYDKMLAQLREAVIVSKQPLMENGFLPTLLLHADKVLAPETVASILISAIECSKEEGRADLRKFLCGRAPEIVQVLVGYNNSTARDFLLAVVKGYEDKLSGR